MEEVDLAVGSGTTDDDEILHTVEHLTSLAAQVKPIFGRPGGATRSRTQHTQCRLQPQGVKREDFMENSMYSAVFPLEEYR